MKTKRFATKLVLNKKTIANLKKDEMKAVEGGGHCTYHGTGCMSESVFYTDCWGPCFHPLPY